MSGPQGIYLLNNSSLLLIENDDAIDSSLTKLANDAVLIASLLINTCH